MSRHPDFTDRIAPLFFHYFLAGHDSSIIFDYIFKLLATDQQFQFAENDHLLPPDTKRGYAQTAFSGIIEMVKLHTSNPAHVEAAGWDNFVITQQTYAKNISSKCKNVLTDFRMIQRIVETLNPNKEKSSKFSALLSSQQIQKNISVSIGALAMVFKCLEVPKVLHPRFPLLRKRLECRW